MTNMSEMFRRAEKFNQPIGNWNVSNVDTMLLMFYRATDFNQPLNAWNVSSVEQMAAMFAYASSFDQPLDQWDVSNVLDMSSIFLDATALSDINYDLMLIGWSKLNVQPNVTVGVDGLKFCAVEARNILKNNHNWNFVGDSPGTPGDNIMLTGAPHWYDDPIYWSQNAFPTFCSDVKILGSYAGTTVISGTTAVAATLEVANEGQFTVELGGVLIVGGKLNF